MSLKERMEDFQFEIDPKKVKVKKLEPPSRKHERESSKEGKSNASP